MRVNRSVPVLVLFLAVLLNLPLILSSVFARSGSRVRPAQTATTTNASSTSGIHILRGGVWRSDGGFVSTIRMQNILVVAPIEVTPILFMADGTAYPLHSITIPISGVATLNVNDALAVAPNSIASHASQFGTVMLFYSYPSTGHLTATISCVDPARSVSFTSPYPFAELMGESMPQSLEGLWWKHDPGVSGFVSIANLTDAETQASVQLVGKGGEAQSVRTVDLPAHSTQMFHLEDLADHPSLVAQGEGGIRIHYTGQMGAVQVMGGLENDAEGYSANIPFWAPDMTSSLASSITFVSPGVMVGKPDPMMMPGFPKETTFTPYLALRNTTAKPLDVSVQLNYTTAINGSAPISQTLAPQRLAPLESRQVDMQAALNSAGLKNFNGSINLSISFFGKAGDVVFASGSVDQTGTYVFSVEPQGVGSSRSKYANYWSAADDNDTMFSLFNPTSTAEDIAVTFYFGDGSGLYKLPVHVAPQGSVMIDMAMLIAEQKPDAEGNIIPANVREGSAEFASAKDRRDWITLVIAGGIYNVSNATCGTTCISCCAQNNNITLNPASFLILVGDTLQCSSTMQDCNGLTIDPNSWSSSNTSVMTVSQNGLVSGLAPGSATIFATYGTEETYTGQICGPSPSCPTTNPVLQSSGSVAPRLNSISPAQGLIGDTVSVSLSGNGFGSSCANITISAGSGITPTCSSASNTNIDASLAISTSAAGANHTVSVTINGQTSPTVNFYVQIPKTLVRSPNYGTNGLGPINVITDASVIDIYGQTKLTHQCGVYENIGYQLVDQNSPPQYIYGNYDLHEHFSNYSSTVQGQTIPPDQDNTITLQETILGDTQSYTKNAPSCPGANDHEQFDQSLSVIVNGTAYGLTMVNTIQRGFYSGTGNVTVTIKQP